MKSKFLLMVILGTVLPFNSGVLAVEKGDKLEPNSPLIERAKIVEWRFKTVDGKVYKRLFDYTNQKWIGDWLKV
ncbi:hypothetical protein [uncultured Vagococcus sp.]|uniref:hypothetical protein n=1 Tax=uncultured Vagococcus sp. TaxID=189676 RepID=UPI0028D45EE4|nr:hypothetical protein [uncultured Vagococcus sp.]